MEIKPPFPIPYALALAILLLCVAATPAPTHPLSGESKVDYSQFSDADIAATEAHKEQLKAQVHGNLNTIVTTSDAQAATLAAAKKSLTDYEAAVKTQIDAGNNAITSLAALVKKHHLDLMILEGLWLGFVALLYLKAGTMLGPAGIYIAGGLALAGTAFILLRL